MDIRKIKTDFNTNQIPLLKEFFQEKEVLKEFTKDEIVLALKLENQEGIGIYDEKYYNLYLLEMNQNIPFKEIPKGSYNHNNFGMYKTKDGQYLIEIQI